MTLRLNSDPVPARAKRDAAPPGAVSNRTVVTMLGVLSDAIDDAMAACGLVARNVARLVERPKVASRDTSTWTPEQGHAVP